ncbi:MAG: hypothetical protein JO144_13310 [Actinobacteria bacterium]|nr:hypothetical protein [Actinomycetota bacterium]
MTEARNELHRLVEQLPESKIPTALSELQRLSDEQKPSAAWPPAWFGSITAGRTDTSQRIDEILARVSAAEL